METTVLATPISKYAKVAQRIAQQTQETLPMQTPTGDTIGERYGNTGTRDVYLNDKNPAPTDGYTMRDSTTNPDYDDFNIMCQEAQDMKGNYIKKEGDNPIVVRKLRSRLKIGKFKDAQRYLERTREQETNQL